MIIDSHQHFWKYDSSKHFWIPNEMRSIRRDFLPEDLLPVLKRNRIDGCIAVQVEHIELETDFLLNRAAEHDFIKGVVGWIDLTAEGLTERLEHYSGNPKFKGIRHTEYDKKGEFLLKPEFRRGLKKLREFDLSFDLLVFPHQLASAVQLAREFPNQAFVLDHLAKPQISEGPSEDWVRNIKQLSECENVYAKVSGMVTETRDLRWEKADFDPFLDVMLDSFGTRRLMFGSDWPVCTAAASYEEVLGIVRSYFNAFSKDEKEAVFGGTAVEFYNMRPKRF